MIIYFNTDTCTLKSSTAGIGQTFNKEYERLPYFAKFAMCCF